MIYAAIEKLIDYAIKKNLITKYDVIVVQNRLMRALGLSDFIHEGARYEGETIDEILDTLTSYAA